MATFEERRYVVSKDTFAAIGHSKVPSLLDTLRQLVDAHRPAFRQERTFRQDASLNFRASLLLREAHRYPGTLCSRADRRRLERLLPPLQRTPYRLRSLERLLLRGDASPHPGGRPLRGGRRRSADSPPLAQDAGHKLAQASQDATVHARDPTVPNVSSTWPRCWPQSGEGYTRALPLRWEPPFPEKAVLAEGVESKKPWEAALGSIRWLREQLDESGRACQRLLVLGDGDFSVAKLRALAPERTVLLTRCARNRALYELPGPEEKRRGRPRFYGPKSRKPHEWLHEQAGWRRADLQVRGRRVSPRYRVEGPFVLKQAPECPVFLIVVKGRRAQRRHKETASPQGAGFLARLCRA